MIKSFASIGKNDLNLVGGKAMSLGCMTQEGFPIPPGFVLTTNAFNQDRSLWESSILENFDKLGCQFVAVRSSGTKEDGIDDSFAGQFDTYLYVDRDHLIQKMIECHDSISGERLKNYCDSKGIDISSIKVAVVIQKMINSEAAGVGFSVHPVTQDQNSIIIEGALGLGEAVVSGSITPDSYIIDKYPTKVIDKFVSKQTKKLIGKKEGGIMWVNVATQEQNMQKITDQKITELSKLIIKIEQFYKFPVDIERAIEDGKIYITQSRPITTLEKVSEGDATKEFPMGNNSALIKKRISQKYHYIHKRFRTPFYTFLLRDSMRTYHNKDFPFDYACDIVYLNEEIAITLDTREKQEKKIMGIFQDNPTSINQFYEHSYDIQNQIEEYYQSYVSRHKELTKSDLIVFRRTYLSLMQKMLSPTLIPLFIEGWMEEQIKTKVMKKYNKKESELYYHNATTAIKVGTAFQEEISLLDIAIVQQDGGNIDSLIEEHLKQFAWTKNNSHDGSFKTYDDVIIQISNISNPIIRKQELLNHFEEVKRGIAKLYEDFHHDQLFKHILDTLQESIYFRSRRTERCYKNAYYIDPIFQVSAKILGLHDYKDIFYLTPEEIINVLEKDNTLPDIANRKKLYVTLADYKSIVTLSGDAAEQAIQQIHILPIKDNKTITGQVAFKGNVKGKAVIVTHKDQLDKIEEGDILVTTATTVNYIPYLKKVKAIVTNEGGVLSHASVISRELQIPTIIGTINATQILNDGDIIEVDANQGIVYQINNIDREEYYFNNVDISYEGGRSCHILINSLLNRSYIVDKVNFPVPLDFGLISYISDHITKRYRYIDDTNKYDIYLNKIINGENILEYIKTHIDKTLKQGIKMLQSNKKIENNSDLLKQYDNYIELYTSIAYSPFVLRFIDRGIVRYVERNRPGQSNDVLQIIGQPLQKSFALLEEEAICRVAQKMYDNNYPINNKHIQKEISNLVNSYAWTTLGYYNEEAKDKSTYESILGGDIKKLMSSYREKEKKISGHLNERTLWLSSQSEEAKRVAHIASEAARLKDYYKYAINRLQYNAEVLWEAIAKKTNQETAFLKDLLPEEIKSLLIDNKIDQEKIKKRIESCIMYTKNGELIIKSGNEAKEFIQKYINPIIHKRNTFQGRTACPGVTTGLAKIVLSKKDFHKVQKGDILIVANTSPDFVPLFDKISGIIAEEGGITAHVSVISREYNIPCIVGVSHITSQVNDGDTIVLDATNASMKIL